MSEVFTGIAPVHDAPPHAGEGRESNPERNLMTLLPQARPGETVEPFKFTGEAGEYFRIWSSIPFSRSPQLGCGRRGRRFANAVFSCDTPGLQAPILNITHNPGRFCVVA